MDTVSGTALDQSSRVVRTTQRPPQRRSLRLVGALTCALAVVGLVTGCASSSSSGNRSDGVAAPQEYQEHNDLEYTDEYPAEVAPDEAAPGGSGGAAPDSGSSSSQVQAAPAIRVETEVRIRVDDLSEASGRLDERVAAAGGRFDHRSEERGSSYASAYFTARIPADAHDSFVHDLGELGEVTSTQTDAEDVTLTKVDLESRIASLESSITSLRGMMAEAKSTTEMLEIERELSEREAEHASFKSQLDVLKDEVTYSTVRITMSTNAAGLETQDSGFLAGLRDGWEGLVKNLGNFVEWIGYVLPGLLLLILIGALIWFAGLRKLVRRIVQEFTSGRSDRTATGDAAAQSRQAPSRPSTGQRPNASPSGPNAARPAPGGSRAYSSAPAGPNRGGSAPKGAVLTAPAPAATSEHDDSSNLPPLPPIALPDVKHNRAADADKKTDRDVTRGTAADIDPITDTDLDTETHLDTETDPITDGDVETNIDTDKSR